MEKGILYIPIKRDSERDSVATAWENSGGKVERLDKFWMDPQPEDSNFAIYGNDTFALVLAQVLNVELLSPRDELICELDHRWTKRDLQLTSIRAISEIQFPRFCKPVTPKLFESRVYESEEELLTKLEGLDGEEQLITSDVISIEAEVRSFILNGAICDLALYEGRADLSGARTFVNEFLSESNAELPSAYVLDVGFNSDDSWFIVEFNAAWGAGLNSCDPIKVIDCIREATVNSPKTL